LFGKSVLGAPFEIRFVNGLVRESRRSWATKGLKLKPQMDGGLWIAAQWLIVLDTEEPEARATTPVWNSGKKKNRDAGAGGPAKKQQA